MEGYFTKRLQQTSPLYADLKKSHPMYVQDSIFKENKQNSFLKHKSFLNTKNGEIKSLTYDFEREHKKQAKLIEQKALTLDAMAKRYFLSSFFGTLTLPSEYHPFISRANKKGRIYVSENREFAFNSIDDGIKYGYKKLNSIFQIFYKRVKNYVGSDLLYVKVFEPHKTMIPHLHFVLYFPEHCKKDIIKAFKKIVSQNNLQRAELEAPKYKDNLNCASKYLLKYITKDLNSKQDLFKARLLDGWRRHHKIRVCTTSKLPLTTEIYKKLYSSLHFFRSSEQETSLKDEIMQEVAILNVPLYLYLQDNTYIKRTIISKNEKKVKTFGRIDDLFKIILITKKKGKRYLHQKFDVWFRDMKIYSKEPYVQMHFPKEEKYYENYNENRRSNPYEA